MKKTFLGVMVILLLTSTLILAFNTKQAKSPEPPATEWSRTYGGTSDDFARDLVQTVDGGYAIGGETNSFGNGSWDFWLVKTDANGNMEWNKTYGDDDNDIAKSVVLTSDGGYAITGRTNSFGAGGYDFWLVKTNSTGHEQWNKTYGGPNLDYADSVLQTVNRGYTIAGHTKSFGVGGEDIWLVKTDATGNMMWNKTYGGPNDDSADSLVQNYHGMYAMAGLTHSDVGDRDFLVIKLAPVEIPATLDINPDTLNLKSRGEWITCYIELPEGYDVNDINVSTILLNDTVHAESHPTSIGDHDDDDITDLMVKFDRAEVISYIQSNLNTRERVCTVTLTITGKLYDGTQFQGRDTIRVLIFRKGDPIPR